MVKILKLLFGERKFIIVQRGAKVRNCGNRIMSYCDGIERSKYDCYGFRVIGLRFFANASGADIYTFRIKKFNEVSQ